MEGKAGYGDLQVMIGTYGERRVAWVQGGDVASALAACDDGVADTLGFSTAAGFDAEALPPASMIGPSVRGVVAIYMHGVDVSAASDYSELEFLALHDFSGRIDLSRLTSLECLRLDWSKGVVLPGSQVPLRSLHMHGYKPVSRDLSDLPMWPNLEELELVKGGVESLSGVSAFRGLKKISLSYSPRLESIEEISALTFLEEIEFDHCARVASFDAVGHLNEVSALKINHCGTIPSVDFVAGLSKLKHFSFVGTTVADGNLTGLLGIEYVGFNDKTHYTHKFSHFKSRSQS